LWGPSSSEGVDAQQQATVTGQVVGARGGNPISDVQVYLVENQRGVLTGANGRFLIVNVAPGTYTVRAERIGYATAEQSVDVTAGSPAVVNFRLEDEALGLDEIVVTGTAGSARRREVGNSISQINVADIPSPPSNVDQLLQARAPGLLVTQGNGSVGVARRSVCVARSPSRSPTSRSSTSTACGAQRSLRA
jgi:TonB-dependent starch-binding outer membrane protein SusC